MAEQPAPILSDARRRLARLWIEAAIRLVRRQLRAEWAGSWPHRWLIARPAPQGQAAAPVEPRPPRPRRGKAILGGRFQFDGLVLETGPGGDPWSRPSPSRSFAEALHRMDWLPDLLAVDGGARAALHLLLGWEAVFGRWNAFAWSAPVLERRVHNLACAMRGLLAEASPAEGARLLDGLARQARHLLLGDGDETRRAERAAAAALAGTVLGGPAGEGLMDRGLARLERALPAEVRADGGHASRSPEAGLELLLDLRALDDGLARRGRPAPAELGRVIDRLAAAVHVLTLTDGRLAALQGGEGSDPERIAAALGEAAAKAPPAGLPQTGYERLTGRQLVAVVDVCPPAADAWSVSACAQPLALEVCAGADRLIVSSAWSPRAPSAQALRLTPAASTVAVSDLSCAHPLQGRLARLLGPRLDGPPLFVRARRHEADGAVFLELSHDGWADAFGLIHERRLYLDPRTDELRGEDVLRPSGQRPARPPRRPPVLVARFQLHPDVKASVALDHQSVLLQPRAAKPAGAGWWLRNDAEEVALEPSVRLADGRPQHGVQVVMRARPGADGLARLRWKLTHADRGGERKGRGA